MRKNPSDGWAIGRWFRRSPLGIGLAALFDDSKIEGDQTLARVSPAFFNNLAAPEWPASAAEPVFMKGKIVGMDLHPVDLPVIGPVPVHYPEVWEDPLPVVQPVPWKRPLPRPVLPEPAPRKAPASRPASPLKTQSEITLVVERVWSPDGEPVIRVRAVQKFKYQIYARTARRLDAKGVYLRLESLITATFGTLTEVQDFVEAAAWNIVGANGEPVMGRLTGLGLDATEGVKNATIRGAVVNFRAYSEAFAGLISGKYSIDLGGFAYDYSMSQFADMEVAKWSKAQERMARALGLDSVIGVEAMLGMHRRLSGMPRQERLSYVREISKKWRSTFADRVYWARSGLRSRA